MPTFHRPLAALHDVSTELGRRLHVELLSAPKSFQDLPLLADWSPPWPTALLANADSLGSLHPHRFTSSSYNLLIYRSFIVSWPALRLYPFDPTRTYWLMSWRVDVKDHKKQHGINIPATVLFPRWNIRLTEFYYILSECTASWQLDS